MADLFTNSRGKAARACQRLHQIVYLLGYRPVDTAETLRFGSLFHRGLESWFLAFALGESVERLNAAMAALEPQPGDEFDAVDLVKAQELLRGYHYRWKSEPLEVLAVEREFRTDLVNPATGAPSRTWRLAGKLDAVVRDLRTGRVLVVEHKTASDDIAPGSDYWKRLRMDGQVSTYYAGARSLEFDVEGCLYDVIKKPAIRIGTRPVLDENSEKIVLDASGARVRTKDGKKWRQTGDAEAGFVAQTRPETPEEFRVRLIEDIAADPSKYFQRGDVVRLDSEMVEAMHDTWQTARQIREAHLAGFYPRNPDACVRYGRTCEFFDVCTGVGSLDDPSRFKRLSDVHPELAGDAASATAELPKEEAAW